ncbi:MAG: hypothetical protein U1G07_00720 [Verrucomicrobiota bacterium]
MNPKLILFLLSVPLLSGTGIAAPAAEENLAQFFQEYLDANFRLRPRRHRLGDHRFDAALDDVSAAGQQQWLQHLRQTLVALPQRVQYDRLARPGQIDFEILQHELVTSCFVAKARPFEEDPRVYSDYINDSVYLLLTQSTLPKETNIANCIARMQRCGAGRQRPENLKDHTARAHKDCRPANPGAPLVSTNRTCSIWRAKRLSWLPCKRRRPR